MKKIVYSLIVFLLISVETNAQFCKKYADKAVSQYQLAKKNNLPNINWPLWTDDWNGHFNWCKTVSHDVADKETAKRQAYLDKYLKNNKTSSKEDFCKKYADNAVKQYNQAKQLKLSGTVPPSWSPDREGHFKWCMTVPQNVAQNEQGIRQAKIDEYKDALLHDNMPSSTVVTGVKTGTVKSPDLSGLIGMKTNICDSYAKKSVNQNKKNISLKCGFEGPGWSSDYKAHYNWCMHGENYLHVDNALGSREKQLHACGGGNIILIPAMVIGLRHSMHQANDPFIPAEVYFSQRGVKLQYHIVTDHANYFDKLDPAWSWITVDKGNFSDDVGQYRLPAGIVICLMDDRGNGVLTDDKGHALPVFGIKNPKTGPEYIGGGNFHKECGGDLGAPAGGGLCWYESTGLGFHDWSAVNNLPRGTVIGLKHSSNQPNKKLKWQGRIYDPADPSIQPPAGFARKNGGDEGAPAGVGYFWYEKITGK